MRTLLTLCFSCLLMGSAVGQTRYVLDRNKKYLEYVTKGEYTFKNHLKDGRWVSLEWRNDTNSKHIETYIKNGLKNGVESRYYSGSGDKYAEVEYKNGMKDGREIHWNGNGTVRSIINYREGIFHGPMITNWGEGEKHFTGHFNNGFQDSSWTYWENSRKDTVWIYHDEAQKRMQYKYINGKRHLWTAWDYDGHKMVENGNGKAVWREYDIVSTEYTDGLKNGLEIAMSFDSTLDYIKTYDRGLLRNKMVFNAEGDTLLNYSYAYPFPTIIDTVETWADEYVNHDQYKEVTFNYRRKYHGVCFEKFDNGTYQFKGQYANGKRIGKWTWYYPSGQPKIQANYATDDWTYFDASGQEVVTDFKGEYITALTKRYWFLNEKLNRETVILSAYNEHMVTLKFDFSHDGTYLLNDYLGCGKDIGSTGGGWNIIANQLTIVLPTEVDEKETLVTHRFEIEEAKEKALVLKRLE